MCNLTFEQFTHQQHGIREEGGADRSLPDRKRTPLGSASADAESSNGADKRLSEDVVDAIVGENYPIESVDAECEHGTVYLSGVVNSWHHKQLVQESVRRVPGVQAITNAIQVQSESPMAE